MKKAKLVIKNIPYEWVQSGCKKHVIIHIPVVDGEFCVIVNRKEMTHNLGEPTCQVSLTKDVYKVLCTQKGNKEFWGVRPEDIKHIAEVIIECQNRLEIE